MPIPKFVGVGGWALGRLGMLGDPLPDGFVASADFFSACGLPLPPVGLRELGGRFVSSASGVVRAGVSAVGDGGTRAIDGELGSAAVDGVIPSGESPGEAPLLPSSLKRCDVSSLCASRYSTLSPRVPSSVLIAASCRRRASTDRSSSAISVSLTPGSLRRSSSVRTALVIAV